MSDAPAAAPVVSQNDQQNQVVEETPGHKVFVGNLAYATTQDGLRAFFEPVASDIVNVQVIQRGTRSAGYGFVAFNTLEAAEKAVAALDKKELDGRTLIIEIAKPAELKEKEKAERRASRRTGRRGSKAPPGEVTEAEANGEAAPKVEGEANEAEDGAAKKKRKSKARKLKVKAKKAVEAVTGGSGEAAEGDAATGTAATTEGAESKKKARQPRKPRERRPVGETPPGEPSKTVLFVANLGFNIDDARLTELFTSNGLPVTTAHVVRRRWGNPRRSKGYGFVDVGSEADQQKALELLQGKEVDGREIAVKVAVNGQDTRDDKDAPTPEREATPEATVLAS